MTHLYILTDHNNIQFDQYKFGYCTGSLRALQARYQTYLPQVKIIFYHQCEDVKKIEHAIKHKFANKLIKNNNSNKSEWFQGDVSELFSFIWEQTNTSGNESSNKNKDDVNEIKERPNT